MNFTHDMYRPVQKLGKFSIAEHTYYNNSSRLHCKDNIFDVFGAYCSKDPYRPESPSSPRFTPREILERQDLWAYKKGLFIYPGVDENASEVAFEFSKISTFELVSDKSSVE